MGVGLALIFAVYTAYSITQVFFITSVTFAGASIWGYTTKRDLTGSRHFYGINWHYYCKHCYLFMASPALMFTISILGVFIFTGLTAWDTQNAKNYISWWRPHMVSSLQ